MKLETWKPLYVDDFDFDKYLYHYTSVEKAIKILYSDSLLFSPLSGTNDTSEAKMKIAFEQSNLIEPHEYERVVKKISEYFKQNTKIVQLLCFSMDAKIKEADKKKYLSSINDKDKYYDVSGRGFALPRMWAQYASNNEGVCFVFDKNNLIKKINHEVAFIKYGPVKYKKIFDTYFINGSKMDLLNDRISKVANGSLTLLDMIQRDKDFLDYNFFAKLDDWSNEHEYRILSLIDNSQGKQEGLPITGVKSFLDGIVIGEKMDKAYEKTIRMFAECGKHEVKRIHFDSDLCKLT